MSESRLQQQCVKWWQYWSRASSIDHRFLVSVPNGGNRDARTGAMLKKEGAIAGVADLILFCPWGKKLPLFIEMKLPNGRQSESQVHFERMVSDAGYTYIICRSFPEFEKSVNEYLYHDI